MTTVESERLLGRISVDAPDPRWIEGTSSAVEIAGTIITHTRSGDGFYPVYALVDEHGQVLGLRVDLVHESERAGRL
jgi:hypothetical protein